MPNALHTELLALLKQADGTTAEQKTQAMAYLGTSRPYWYIRAADLRALLASFEARHPDLTFPQFVDLLQSLGQGETCNEISMVGTLLARWPDYRRQIDPRLLDAWLNAVEGWGETDALCQSVFDAADLLAHWEQWQELLDRFVTDGKAEKRRASLVLLTRPVHDAADARLADAAFAYIERLKGDRDILVTKAVSWLLRALIKHHRERVTIYLEANQDVLPRVAVREVRNKLQTGKK